MVAYRQDSTGSGHICASQSNAVMSTEGKKSPAMLFISKEDVFKATSFQLLCHGRHKLWLGSQPVDIASIPCLPHFLYTDAVSVKLIFSPSSYYPAFRAVDSKHKPQPPALS